MYRKEEHVLVILLLLLLLYVCPSSNPRLYQNIIHLVVVMLIITCTCIIYRFSVWLLLALPLKYPEWVHTFF